MNPNFLPPGHLLHQRYSIQQSLGQGGFGITYLAYDSKLEKEVCVKELFIAGNSTRGADMTVNSQSIQGFSFEDFVNRFVEEARKQAQFDHPNIVRVFDVFHSNATAYMVMEYVKGETLKQKVQKEGALSEHVAMKLIDQLLNGVEEVHKKGMLHRDIKPDNILITDEGKLVLIDFGSAREFSDGKTITHTAMLTPGYAPMEQYSDRAQRGPYTDIYALGGTIYFILTGQKPIAATDRSFEDLLSPNQINSAISNQFSNVVMNSMELKPDRRFQRISEMREALNMLERRKGMPAEKPEKKNEEGIPSPQKPVTKKGKGIGGKIAVAVLIMFIGTGIAYYIQSGVEHPELKTENQDVEKEDGQTQEAEERQREQQEQEQRRKQEEQRRKGRQQLEEQRQREQQEQEQRRKQEEQRQKELQQLEESRRQEQTRNSQVVQNLRNDMVLVQGGAFTMGCTSEQGSDCYDDEKPAHQVTLSSFYVSKYEVTQALWQEVMGANPSHFKGCDRCPVESVSWDDVKRFIRKLNQISGKNYRLPTEAEWEYAARGGSASRGYKYSGGNNPGEVGWYGGNSSDKTQPVGKKMSNELGLYDMSGNVWEWCSDWYGSYSTGSQRNPLGPSSGSARVYRGGGWFSYPRRLWVSYRNSFTPAYRYFDLGFRLALSQ